MSPITASLRTLRYYDRLVIRGRRMMLGLYDSDPCTHQGHEDLIAFLSMYVDYMDIDPDHYKWDQKSLGHLDHITGCRYCLAKVYSTPDSQLRLAIEPALAVCGA